MSECRILLERCQGANERRDYGFDLTENLIRKWRADTGFAASVAVRPSTLKKRTGLQYVSSGGQSGAREPAWPTEIGETVTDGTITWTAEAYSTDSLEDTLATADWTAPAGLTIDGEDTSQTAALQQAAAFASGGTEGTTYDATCLMVTTFGREFEGILRLTIEGVPA